ncbi:MAG: class III poly(R)-hydroxyalkanoic acid synthase subunit PhaC [Sphingobacteriales bacterium]|nr:MAG: class III poly(R)-hydroxyalkanoic acid synthase subunit PhaC [Sphingobacteriales bacterium]
MTFNPSGLFEELTSTTQKLAKGYETLQNIKNVDVAVTPKELVWQRDKVKLYHYTRETPAKCKIPVLVSFAMLNRHDVLDLQPDRSLMKKLLEEGLDIYIMDWGYPTQADKYLTMEDYIDGYMNDAVDFIRRKHKVPKIHKQGICQAGTYSMIYASRYPEKLQTLTTYVAPFDFGENENMLYKWAKHIDIDTMVDNVGTISGEMIDSAFSMLKPSMNVSKYIGVMDSLEDEDKLLNFLRMESWKADLPAIPGEMYRKYIKDLFRDNLLIKGTMTLGGKVIDLSKMTVPYLNVYATGDAIIPNDSTKAVMSKIGSTDKQEIPFPGGHIGVFVGTKSQKDLAPAVAKWTMDKSK